MEEASCKHHIFFKADCPLKKCYLKIKEICKEPKLVGDRITASNVVQGSLGIKKASLNKIKC